MILLDYIYNLAIFSLLVSTPLVVNSFFDFKPSKHFHLWGSVYAGLVSYILVMLSVHYGGYSYDIRYASVILAFSYLGPVAGIITGLFALLARLLDSGHWYPAIFGWIIIMIVFSSIALYASRLSPVKRCIALYGSYLVIYIMTVPIGFKVFRDQPMFHFQYLLFVMIGVIIGVLLIESYVKLYKIINEKKRLGEILAESEAKYRLIAENTSDLIMVMNKEHSIVYLSPSHETMLGYDRSELGEIGLYKLIHPDDTYIIRTNMRKMFEENESHSMETRVKHKEGHWIVFESCCMPVKGETQFIEHIVIISRDITERIKAEEILVQSEKLSVIGELAAGVAHEIRNPLTTIKGFVQLYNKGNQLAEYNDLILSELERIETITNELLSLGKPQAVQLKRSNVKDLIEYTVGLLSPEAHLNNTRFKLDYEESTFFITCERNQLKQVFLNILKNAIEAMPSGGDIHINLEKGVEDECIISIQDQGCGIPEELLPRLGEPFYSLKEKGTGLGVMISHKIIRQHDGSISYKSKVGEGTLVEIRLPLG
ncbi:PAS domain S-box protein [bacterium LRH843]|nr:PAS domain S-box protein [bacterium LRH843]